MDDPIFDFLRSKFHITKKTYSILQGLANKRKLKSGENIVEQGDISNKVAFLTSGLMRAYITLESGKDITKNIFSPISFVGPFSSILKNKPSLFCYEVLVDSSLYEIDFQEFIEISKSNIEISNLYNRILESVFIKYEAKQLEILALDATQRYLELKRKIPSIETLIPQYQIASYLNISAVQLSRIRRTLR